MTCFNQFRFTLWDVGHGLSIWIETPNGQNHWIDVGRSDNFSPSVHVAQSHGVRFIDYLILSHPDRDHLNDLPNFMSVFPESPGVILQNKTIPTAIRYDPPEADYSQCLMSLDDRLRYSVADDRDPSQPSINGGVEYTSSFNSYVSGMTTNNASVVTMISFRGLVIVCPGDIEDSGWRRFWSNSGHLFEQKLRNASCVILVAPHHGGHSCYSKQLLENVRPNVCLISDLWGRTETHEAYRLFPMGYRFFNGPSSEYYSTKSTGSRIKIWVDEPGFFYLDQYKERT